MSGVWILSTVRTGSSYLCELLNQTHLFTPKFAEWTPKYKSRNDFLANLPVHNKIHYSQFKRFLTENDKLLLESLVGGIKYIRLTRRDRFAQSVSFGIAKKYQTFYLNSQDSAIRWQAKSVYLSDSELLEAWHELGNTHEKWSKFVDGEQLELTYEMLAKNPTHALKLILDHVGIEHSLEVLHRAVKNVTTYPTTKPENAVFAKRLRALLLRHSTT